MKQKALITLLASLALSACGSGNSDSGTGTLDLSITDAPVDKAYSVVIQFSGLEIKPENGDSIHIDYDTPKQIDLLNLQGINSEPLLEDEILAVGHYNWIRLKVDAEPNVVDSYIEISQGGAQHELTIPSGSQTGLKLVSGFDIISEGNTGLIIDFDLRKSILEPTGNSTAYKLKPALRILDTFEVGHITGSFTAQSLLDAGCVTDSYNAVYLFDGADATPDDFGGSNNEPITSAIPILNETTGDYDYAIGFVQPGSYTLALTCEADSDVDPEVDEDVNFISAANVDVVAGATSEQNL